MKPRTIIEKIWDNHAMEKVLDSGRVTADLKPKGTPATTDEVGAAVCEAI